MNELQIHFEAERWLSQHPEVERKYTGEYIALVGPKLVAHGKDFTKVIEEAKKYSNDPLIVKLRKEDVIVV